MDVETAFLNGELDEDVYMNIPIGVKAKEGKVLKLKRSLYGLKQSPRCWNKKFTGVLKTNGYIQCEADACLFVRTNQNGEKAAIAIYVDDCVIMGNKNDVQRVKQVLTSSFKMKDLGHLSKVIGIEIIRDDEQTKIHQAAYIRDLLDKFKMTNAKEADTPALVNNSNDTSEYTFGQLEVYQSLVGSLLYISTKTRPDIAFAVHEIAIKMSNPSHNDWIAAKRVLRYLKGTQDVGLTYMVNGTGKLEGYADASFAPKKSDRKSIGGYTYLLNGAAISWKSKKQSIIALSSCEAELIALTEAVKEGLWLSKLVQIFEGEQQLTIYEDNQPTIQIIENSIFSNRTKHIQVRHQFVRDMVERKELRIVYCKSAKMTADILTKSLSRVLHERHSRALGLDIGEHIG
jgi:uncharacterized protein YuzE